MLSNPELITFFTAMLPFVELKLAIPLGRELGLSITSTFLFAVAGSIVPAVINLAVIGPLSTFVRKHSQTMDKFFIKLFEKTRKHHSKNFNRYGAVFLIALIAIPIPGSGTVTASTVLFLFGVDFWRGVGFIALGAICSGFLLLAGFESVFAILNLFT